ncbi:C2H2-type zinc finger protein [Endozoicomonas euniceicola]|uniref:C2H2-type zinc finger protein n=1 Tax=Endozoicomonas euniceicola TaxID=1234143 RepID=A0ABY6GNM8_9GAMM|nr:C2H2-type zinc finger protein [Endozoicomonas euniceicola]UYM14345.1 C2H2-type zinc finger protein [Endozoicomonas euniceicola]
MEHIFISLYDKYGIRRILANNYKISGLPHYHKTNEERVAHIEGLVREVRYEANEGDPYQALDGQKHVVAAKKLSKGTVLGHYRGSLWLIDENAPSPECGTLDQQISYSVNCDYKGEEATDDCQEMYWLSGYDDGNIFSCVNDCTVTSNADDNTGTLEPNVSFIIVYMDDFPVVMVVTTEDIPEGKGLWLSYGEPYWDYKNEPVVVPDGDDDHSGAGAKNKKCVCDVCGRELANSGNLARHKRTHTEDKPYKCDVCQKRFAYSSNLLRHQRTHTGDKPYECDECKRRFSLLNYLIVHKRTHTGEKPYKCDVCQKGFAVLGSLIRHKRTHSREKPYKCDVCQKGFAASGDLARHKRTHTGEKPYECDKCQKRFTDSGNLAAHKRTHTGERPYECDVCENRFACSNNLARHKRTQHKESPTEQPPQQ